MLITKIEILVEFNLEKKYRIINDFILWIVSKHVNYNYF